MAFFISHAQNLEDVMLWRALGTVETGFYIDLGASDPQLDSVTLAFYERGWRGINVEPNPDLFQQIAAQRERDINLNVCVGAAPSEAEFFIVDDDHRLSTMNEELAQRHSAAGHVTRRVATSTLTLRQVCQDHVAGPIHFLKIDIEGAELEALQGADFTRWRPWVILVEALDPTTLVPSHQDWEPLLTKAGYHFVYFDGLNRFYVADEHGARLDPHFQVPPNGRDGFVRSAEAVQMQLRNIEATHAQVAAALHEDVYRLAAERDACVQDRQETHRLLQDSTTAAAALRHETAQQIEQLTAERDACARDRQHDAATATACQHEAEQQMERLAAERDGWMQELFESNRHAAYLAQQRQSLLTRLAPLEGYSANLESHTGYLQDLLDTAQAERDDGRAALGTVHAELRASRAECGAIQAELGNARADLSHTHGTVARLEHEQQSMRAHIEAQDQLLASRLALIHQHERQLEALRYSTSWRLTLPLRAIRRMLAGGRG